MNLSWIDWSIVIGGVVFLRFISLSTSKYMKGVTDFLSANRAAGRYLLTIASTMGGTGVMFFAGLFEVHNNAGFTSIWWRLMTLPVPLIATLAGWIYYRFRETRALTMAQFLEQRYSRRFRIFAGILIWVSGMLNFAIFPAVAARFFLYFCGLPDYFYIPGIPVAISTFATIMALDLVLALTFVNMGGQVSVMVTECVQGILCGIAFVLLSATVLVKLSWPEIVQALNTAPADASMLHPFRAGKVEDFNFWFFMIMAFYQFYNWLSWQGSSGFHSSPRTPHECQMANIIAVWRLVPQFLVALLLGIAGYCVLHLSEFSAQAAQVQATLKTIDNSAIATQVKIPIALGHFLPVVMKGIFAAMMLFCSFTSHDTYMHSWGTILIQDVVIPIRNKALTTQQHIRWLQFSIIGVAVWGFLFGLFYQQTEKILMFTAITGVIWLGGAGAVITGGLYWKRGTTAGAYCALIVGAVLGVSRLIAPHLYKRFYHQEFPISGQWTMFIGMVSACLIYIVVSLWTSGGKEFNLDRLLYRGEYADHLSPDRSATASKWSRLIGITSEYSRGDRILAVALLVWNLGWTIFFAVVTVINLMFSVETEWWAKFWYYYVILHLAISIPTTIWLSFGGISDIRMLFHDLSTGVRDHSDDGSVVRQPGEPSYVPKSEPAKGVSQRGLEEAPG